jgi:4-oxalomesaconate tautomerase
VPWNCHAAFAVTGALCLGAAACIPGTVAHQVARGGRGDDRGADVDAGHGPDRNARTTEERPVVIEHPSGKLETRMSMRREGASPIRVFERAGIVRTARPLLDGVVHIPAGVWHGYR